VNRQPNHDPAFDRMLRDALSDPSAVPTEACLDADLLAAWSEGGLTPNVRRHVERHLSTCGHCQSALALLARSEPATSPAAPLWRLSPARWFVPIAAGAAAVLIWIAVPWRVADPGDRAVTTTARVEPPEARPMPPDVPPGAAPTDAARTISPQAPPVGQDANSARERRSEPAALAPRAFEPPAKTEAAEAFRRQPPADVGALADRAAAAAPTAADLNAGRQERDAGTVEVVSPDPSRRWRIRGATVERSADAGASWDAVRIAPPASVTAGMSPAPLVCWLVGPGGAVFRTIDGTAFDRVSSPTGADLISVRADDGSRASVTSADGRVYSTTDGGVSWQ
jgi:hypothetical protein